MVRFPLKSCEGKKIKWDRSTGKIGETGKYESMSRYPILGSSFFSAPLKYLIHQTHTGQKFVRVFFWSSAQNDQTKENSIQFAWVIGIMRRKPETIYSLQLLPVKAFQQNQSHLRRRSKRPENILATLPTSGLHFQIQNDDSSWKGLFQRTGQFPEPVHP